MQGPCERLAQDTKQEAGITLAYAGKSFGLPEGGCKPSAKGATPSHQNFI